MTTIVTKNGSGAPLASDLVQGELAVDLTNKRLYTEDSGGSVIEVGTNPTSLTTGTFTSVGIDDNATSTAITIDASENVGIGTASPARPLNVAGGSVQYPFKLENTSATQCTLTLNDANTTSDAYVGVGAVGNEFIVRAGNGERMRIDSSGNVGIGTSSPAFTSGNKGLHISDLTSPAIRLQDSGRANADFTIYIPSDSNSLRVYHENSAEDVFTINSVGNVGIGTTSPNDLLELGGASTVLRLSGTAGTGGYSTFAISGANGSDLFIQADRGGNGDGNMVFRVNGANERMRIDSSGNLLVGTTSSPSGGAAGVQVYNNSGRGRVDIGKTATGNANAIANYHNGTYVGGVNYSDTVTSFPTSSDVRLKENIVDAPAGNIDAIRVRSFDWKVDGTHQTYGMVAQELVDVAPEAVSQGETEDDVWGVDYSKLVPMMIKEIQDLKAEVAALKGA